MTELRSAALATELERAIDSGTHQRLLSLLCGCSGLPGPRANEKLAWALAQAIAAHGSRGDALVRDLCSGSHARSPERGPTEFLPIVGAFCLSARFTSGANADAVLAELRPLSEDSRHLVRKGVVAALSEMGRAAGDELVRALAAWTSGYLSAAVLLDAMTTRSWLDRNRSPDALLSRLDEAFKLVEEAPRADQRSQGYRELLRKLPDAWSRLLDRFARETLAWLEAKAVTEHVELREALGQLVGRIRAPGHARESVERFERSFAASSPPRRDPRTYVGPTRRRGARRR